MKVTLCVPGARFGVVGLALAGAVWLGLEFYGEAIDTESTGDPGAAQPNDTP